MINLILWLMALLLVKHFLIDFVWQTDAEVANKGTYGNGVGIGHSIKHGLGTLIVLGWFTSSLELGILIALVDSFIHYHVDWLKMNVNRHYGWGPQDRAFWVSLGLDQLAHGLTYVYLIYLMFN